MDDDTEVETDMLTGKYQLVFMSTKSQLENKWRDMLVSFVYHLSLPTEPRGSAHKHQLRISVSTSVSRRQEVTTHSNTRDNHAHGVIITFHWTTKTWL